MMGVMIMVNIDRNEGSDMFFWYYNRGILHSAKTIIYKN